MKQNQITEKFQNGVLEFAASSKRDEKEISKALVDIRVKFSKWRWYIIGCVASYFVLFLVSKGIVNWVKPQAKEWVEELGIEGKTHVTIHDEHGKIRETRTI